MTLIYKHMKKVARHNVGNCGDNNNKNEDIDSNINKVNNIREVDVLLSVHQL